MNILVIVGPTQTISSKHSSNISMYMLKKVGYKGTTLLGKRRRVMNKLVRVGQKQPTSSKQSSNISISMSKKVRDTLV